MKVQIISKTEKGTECIIKLSNERGPHKKIICNNPTILEINLSNIPLLNKFIDKNRNPAIDSMITTTWINVMEQYGASKNDYEIKIIN